jgi:peptidoglycan biosynthesis protein MviN/MurJ (putative lipid II flippase)
MIYGVAIGMVIGGVLYLLIIIWFCRGQLSLLLPRPLHYHQSISLLGNGVLALVVQACFGVAGIMVFRRCANATGVGANTILTLAVGLVSPLILAISQLIVRAYPEISRAANTAYRNQHVLQGLLRKVIYQNIVICLPVSIMVLFLGRPACYVLFHTGAFDSSATNITADVLQVYGLSIFVYVTSFLFDRTLLVLRKLKVLVGLSALEFIILSVLATMLSTEWGVVALAFAPVIAVCLKCLASGTYLYATKFLGLRPRLRPFLGLCISVTVLFSSMLILNHYMFSNMTIDRLTLAFHVLIVAFLGIVVFALVQTFTGNSIFRGFLITEGDQ